MSANVTKRPTALMYAATIAGYPVISATAVLLSIDGRITSVLFRAAALLLSVFVSFRLLLKGRLYRGAAWLPIGIFWMLYLTRIAADIVFRKSALPISAFEFLAFAFGTCLIPLISFLGDPGDEVLDLTARYVFLSAAMACVLAVQVTIKELALGTSQTYGTGRLGFESLNPIQLGHLGVSLTLMSICFWPRQGLLGRLALLPVMGAGLFIAGAAGSRGPVLAFLICSLVLTAILVPRMPIRRQAAGLLALIAIGWALIAGALLLEATFGFRIVTRFTTASTVSDESSVAHVQSLQAAIQDFLSHPVFGSGLSVSLTNDYPHNVLVESFMATGVLGGLMFTVFLVWALRSSVTLLRNERTRWLALLMIQQVIAGLTAGALYLSAGMWCLCAAVIAVASNRRHGELRRARLPSKNPQGFGERLVST